MKRSQFVLALLGCVPISAIAATPTLHLDPLVSDHAVLQRGQPIAITGTATAGARVTVQLAARVAKTQADAAGRWRVTLPALPAGGPYSVSVHDDAGGTQAATDVMIGDVWLCSGQSNMELPVSRSLNPDAEIKAASNPNIRLFTVSHDSSPTPKPALPATLRWSAVTPTSIGNFSAACYYFARDLQAHVHVPMGLVHASWGGSNIEAWVPADALRASGDYAAPLALNAKYASSPPRAMADMADQWQAWWHKAARDDSAPWQPNAPGDWKPMPLPWRDWKTWDVASLRSYDGLVWFRRTVTLTAAQAQQAATLDTGAIDEEDQSWVNGVPVGNSFGWAEPRHYALPKGTLHAGENTIVINVYSAWDKGGMFGPADAVGLTLGDGTRVPLGTDWHYWQPSRNLGAPPHAPWHTIGGLTGMYNAMIAPLGHPALRGVLWYQGESNTGNAAQYEGLLTALKTGWRAQFGSKTPFLIVQLPNFGTPNTKPVASGWAEVRDAERRAVARDPLAALAVTIDLGLDNELHPPNKQGVGARLARAAEALIYHAPISASGPLPVAAVRHGDGVDVAFKDVTGALRVTSGMATGPFELCGPDQSSCVAVSARLSGQTAHLQVPAHAAVTRVRYCWGDAPKCAIYDGANLPLTPFELPVK